MCLLHAIHKQLRSTIIPCFLPVVHWLPFLSRGGFSPSFSFPAGELDALGGKEKKRGGAEPNA